MSMIAADDGHAGEQGWRAWRTWRGRVPRLAAGRAGAIVLALIVLPCFVTLPWALDRYDAHRLELQYMAPSAAEPMGTDRFGRSFLWRVMMGGAVSLSIGAAAAGIAVGIGVTWGALAGYVGGRVDAGMMRAVDVLYGLPDILMVILLDLALRPSVVAAAGLALPAEQAAMVGRLATLALAIGAVSWLTMARVIRGQVLSLRSQPFIEAARACGYGPGRIIRVHLLPNLVGPIVVYSTLTVPVAILQESFLSFLGIGVQAPLPSWGNLASEGLTALHALAAGRAGPWWLLLLPCLLLGLTLMALNFLGDALRSRLDPRGA
ncbi:MAG: ABC transporter permease [Phycisphaeraceae bacterium]